ncbi:4-hydroxybenzoyl-CoA thioesterase [Actibacterium atlanticum]|uniref:4-hydroxybenzoyl-CoA thioesterase n=1 Tax=Actibacterium atlanticum TaxID=1461693 RepID=A0A058ZPB0_9RHOB|nr:tol-pal system-associated acyl-CoA thioesterase [Actibacterium atlanticum]KCV83070.1 4-hydroxybenzoyl-CoA thioesterase [Actibacterium atlanticum]
MSHRFPVRVFYEDTDMAGVVYYANYLKFIERGRSEMVREQGLDQGKLGAEQGVYYAVRRVEADYLRPARYDDQLEVETIVTEITGARVYMDQNLWRGEELIFKATVMIVCVDKTGMPMALPAENRQQFARGLA